MNTKPAISAAATFTAAAEADRALGVYTVESRSEGSTGFAYLSFAKPSDILISRWYPGYRVTDLTGPEAEEAIALLLGAEMATLDDLEEFRRLLASPGRAAAVIARLFPRAGIPLKDRKYIVSEEMIATAVRDELVGAAGTGDLGLAAQTAFTYAITRVLSAKGYVAPGDQKRIVRTAESLAVSAGDLRRIIVVEAMRGIFSESRIQAAVKDIDAELTPQILGERVGEMFRHFAFSIPEIKLRLEQFDMAVSLIRVYCVKPEMIPNTLLPHPSLGALASLANFVLYSSDMGLASLVMPAFSTEEMKAACNEVLSIIQTAPSIELLSMTRYAEFFGEVPASSPDGFRRGTVLYTSYGQTSKMEVVDVYPQVNGSKIALVDAAYVRASGLAGPLTGSLLSVNSLSSLANIVADELAMSPLVFNEEGRLDPTLLTIQVTPADLVFLAMARAKEVAFTIQEGSTPGSLATPQLMYGCTVAEQWRIAVTAATPSMAFFFGPADVIVYTSKMVAFEPKPMPNRSQSIGAQLSRDMTYVGELNCLFKDVAKPFTVSVSVNTGMATPPHVLKLKIGVLGILSAPDGSPIDRGDAYYAAVAEPGVDVEISTILRLVLEYAKLGMSDIQGDKARSWLVVNLAPLMLHPAVRTLTERAINTAVIETKIDARRLAPQMREVYTRAMFGTALAVLNRFGKLDAATAASLVSVVPTSTLSLQAGLTLAQIPAAISGVA